MSFKEVSVAKLIFLVTVFLMLFGNISFFSNVLSVYPYESKNILFLISLVVFFSCAVLLIFSLVSFKKIVKPVLILVILLSSGASYFMDTYNIVIDDAMIDNVMKTDMAETLDLLSIKLVLYVLLLGVLPAVYIYKVKIVSHNFKTEVFSRLKLFFIPLILVVLLVAVFNSFYASFFREHKILRFYANPTYYIYSMSKYVAGILKVENTVFEHIALDAFIPKTDVHRELIVLVVGETARSDRFELNGYEKATNPQLKKENIVSFTNVWACGTSTATSVPCMFSILGADEYSKSKARSIDNSLDILQRAGVNVIWLDNNSDSKGVALRIPHDNYKTSDLNPVCDEECRDEGMLSHLQEYIDKHPSGDIFIVLHQMGNHGPAYYKRYPKSFEKFTPACKTNQLESCTNEEINNAYDNAILYTDDFLAKTIAILKNNDEKFEASMLYISDHGESLGENGLYLHGLPSLFAPDEQKHVPMMMWFSDSFDHDEINYESLQKKRNDKFSHDNLFHTILGLMEIKTSVYDNTMDIIEHDGEG